MKVKGTCLLHDFGWRTACHVFPELLTRIDITILLKWPCWHKISMGLAFSKSNRHKYLYIHSFTIQYIISQFKFIALRMFSYFKAKFLDTGTVQHELADEPSTWFGSVFKCKRRFSTSQYYQRTSQAYPLASFLEILHSIDSLFWFRIMFSKAKQCRRDNKSYKFS